MKNLLYLIILISSVASGQVRMQQEGGNINFADTCNAHDWSTSDSSKKIPNTKWVKQVLNNVLPVIATGTYTPPLTSQTQVNVSSVTSYAGNYLKVNDYVVISGRFTITATASGTVTTQTFEIPFASTFGTIQQLSGTINCVDTNDGGVIQADTGAGNRAKLSIKINNTASHEYQFIYSYRLL